MFMLPSLRPPFRLVIVLLTLLVILFSVLAVATARAAPNAPTFTVNSTLDAVDAHPGDGVCATSGNLCTLRAAIMEANHTPAAAQPSMSLPVQRVIKSRFPLRGLTMKLRAT